MKNDKERKAFVEDERNWRIVDSTNNMMIRMKMLTYRELWWFKVEAIHIAEWYDVKRGQFVKEPKWFQIGMYDGTTSGVLGEHVSVTQIVNRLKDYDRERREGKSFRSDASTLGKRS